MLNSPEIIETVEHLRIRNDVIGAFYLQRANSARFVVVAESATQCLDKVWADISDKTVTFEVMGLRTLKDIVRAAERSRYVAPENLELADSEIVFDTMSMLEDARLKLVELMDRRFSLDESLRVDYRAKISKLLADISSGSDDDLITLFEVGELASIIIRCYLDMRGIRWTDTRRAVNILRKDSPELHRNLSAMLTSSELSEKKKIAVKIAEDVLDTAGGLRRPGEVLIVGKCSRCSEGTLCLRTPEDDAVRYFSPVIGCD